MPSLLDLYNLRRNIAQNRQSNHTPLYTQLHDFLVSLGNTHSYDLSFESKSKFESLSFFVDDTFGGNARIPSGADDFVYRVCSIVDIVKGTRWRHDEGTDLENWHQIYTKSKGGWIRLSKLAAGTYTCSPRHFSWWTSFPLYQDVISSAHRIGMTNDWIAEHCVVLRCPIDYINRNNLAFVPSVIDAFMQMIFHPTRDTVCPPYGITIDLSLYPVTLTPGIDEVVLRQLPVEEIEILPVHADSAYRKGKTVVISNSPEFSMLLEYYYQNI